MKWWINGLIVCLAVIIGAAGIMAIRFYGRFRRMRLWSEKAREKKALFAGKYLNSGGLDIDPLFPVWAYFYDDRITFEFDDREFTIDMNRMLKLSVLYDSQEESYPEPEKKELETAARVIGSAFGYALLEGGAGTRNKKVTYLVFNYVMDIESGRRSSVILIDNGMGNRERFIEEFEKRQVWN